MTKAALLTAASVLAMWDAASDDAARLAAAGGLAEFVRSLKAQADAKPVKAAAETDGGNPLTFDAKNFSAALARACAVTERRNTVPILSNIMLHVEAGRLTLTTTDLDLEYVETMIAPDLAPLSVTVPAHSLADVVNGCIGAVGMKLEEGGNRLIVTVGGAENKLPILPVSDFPIMAFEKPDNPFAMTVASLRDPLAFVASCISTEETRYYMNGAYMHIVDGQLAFVATDGHRMKRDLSPLDRVPANLPNLIIPRKTVGWLIRNLPGAGEVTFAVSKLRFRITTPRSTFTSKTIDGSFPDYPRVIPSASGQKASFTDAKAASEVIARLSKVSAERSRATKFTMTPTRGLNAYVRNMEAGQSTAEVPGVMVMGEFPDAGFNAGYLLDMLAAGSTMEVDMAESSAPALILWPDYPGRVGAIMPLRL